MVSLTSVQCFDKFGDPVLQKQIERISTRGCLFAKTKIATTTFCDLVDNRLDAYKDGHLKEEREILDDIDMGYFDEPQNLVHFLDPTFYNARIKPFIPEGHKGKERKLEPLSTTVHVPAAPVSPKKRQHSISFRQFTNQER